MPLLILNHSKIHVDEKPIVRVDVIGIGASVYDQLKQSDLIEVEGVNVSCASTVATYARLRDEIWFRLRDWLKAGGCIPRDARLEAELVSPTYSMSPAGKVQVESKDAMKARLKRSPDRADALALCVQGPVAKRTTAEIWADGNIGDMSEMIQNFANGGRYL